MRRRGKRISSDFTQFAKDLFVNLKETYILQDGTQVEGQAFSWLVKCLREDGWSLPGRRDDQNELLERIGLRIEYGTNTRGNRAEVVYFEGANEAAISGRELHHD